MDHFQETARQLALEFDGGTALLNRFARRLWGRSQRERDRAEVEWSFPWNDDAGGAAVTRGTPALLNHCRRLLGEDPLRVIHHGNRRVCIEVFGVLEYVIDPGAGCLVMIPSGQGAGFVVDGRAREEPAIRALAYERVDLLEPLRSPLWLQLLAFGPGGICEGRGEGDLRQGQLWADCPNVVHALRTICDQAIAVLRKDAGFRRLEAVLSFCLIKYIGAEAVRLTLRSRARSYLRGFDARNVTKVWRFQAVFSRVDRENPMLLPLLQAWLQEDGSSDAPPPEAAISSMRRDLIESGLPVEAWRYVCKHGPRLLARCRGTRLSWSELLLFLRILRDARWPDPPPRGFLGLLYDTAGIPAGYLDPGDGVPGWFWNWACREANACHHDPQAFRRLKDEIVRWAWLVRAYRPRPDSNQQRRGMKWLRTWATLHESMTGLSDEDAWALWLRNIPWDRVTSLRVVPLLSPRSLREEGIAMHNCADRYLSECRKGGYALLSLRDPRSQRRVALLGMCLDVRSDEWRLRDLAGPCNSSVPEWIREVAHDVVHMANAARQKRRDPHVIREKDAERMANALV